MKTILLIDVEAERSGLADILSGFGYEVIAVQDGPSALSVIKAGTPVDLVITDHWITVMNGLELLDSLRRLSPAIPSIMLTAHGSIETYLKACSLGVFEYVNKPVAPRELGRIVKAALERPRPFEHAGRVHLATCNR